jgi:hypothetical protein
MQHDQVLLLRRGWLAVTLLHVLCICKLAISLVTDRHAVCFLLARLLVTCRLSGTGSAGATIRMYIEQYTDDKARLKEDAQVALKDIIKVR